MAALSISILILWFAVVLLAVGEYSLARLIREFLTVARPEKGASSAGLVVGASAPAFLERTVTGEKATLQLGAERGTYILFTSSGCLVCEHVLSQMLERISELADLSVAFIVSNSARSGLSPQWVGFRLRSSTIQVIAQSDLQQAFHVPAFPYLVHVDGQGRISSHRAVADWSDIWETLVAARKAAPLDA